MVYQRGGNGINNDTQSIDIGRPRVHFRSNSTRFGAAMGPDELVSKVDGRAQGSHILDITKIEIKDARAIKGEDRGAIQNL